MLRWRDSAARKPIGARQASTAQTSAKTCSCSVGATPARRALAQHGGAGVEHAAADERRHEQREVAQIQLRGAGQQQHQRRPDGVPGVGDREQQAVERTRVRGSSPTGVASSSPAATRNGTAPGGSEHEHREQHELRRQHVAGADRELDAGEDRVERRRATAATPGSNPLVAPRQQQQGAGRRDEQQRGDDLVRSSRRGRRRVRPSQESSSRRSAAASLRMSSMVLTLVWLSAAERNDSAGGPRRGRATGGQVRPAVGIDVDVVDRPGAAEVLGIEDDLHRTPSDRRSTGRSTVRER